MTTIISSPLPSHFPTESVSRKRSSTTMNLTPVANTASTTDGNLFVFTPTPTPGSKRMRLSLEVPRTPRHCYYNTNASKEPTREFFFPATPPPAEEEHTKENPSLWIPTLDDNDVFYPEPPQMTRPVRLKPRFRFSEIDDNDDTTTATLPAPRPIPPQQPLAFKSISLSFVFPSSAPLMPREEDDHKYRMTIDKENNNSAMKKPSSAFSKSHSFADSATSTMGLLSLLPRNKSMLLQQAGSGGSTVTKTVLRRSSSCNVV